MHIRAAHPGTSRGPARAVNQGRRAAAPCAGCPRRIHPRRRPAFTLLELLVAMTISSLLVVSVVSATRALTSTRETAQRRLARVDTARRALDGIVAALRNVRRDPIRGQPVLVGTPGTGGDRIDLLVIDPRRVREDGAESDQQEVGFYLATPPGRALPVLLMRRDHGLDEHADDGGIATVVAEGIVRLKFEYPIEGRWVDVWAESEPRAPDAVRVTVAAVSPDDAAESAAPPRPVVLSTVVRIVTNEATEPPLPEGVEGPPQPGQPQPEGGPR